MNVKELLKSKTMEELLELWEMTIPMSGTKTAVVRGWLMDEIESRNPKAFDEWLESAKCADEELRNYMAE